MIHKYLKIFTTIKLVNTFFTSHNYLFVVAAMMRALKLSFHSNCQFYNTVSLPIVTMLYIKPLQLINL